MIVSVNPKPTTREFASLMAQTDALLNLDALKRRGYYLSRNGSLLEDDVLTALRECAIGTPFENTVEKVSGQKFPDIVASKFYGIEVKSTKSDHWISTGSSILETTRIPDVERIYMTFGKLGGNPIQFLSKPYEECLSGIAVTHMPRYLIDMRLEKGQTIFDKLGIPYDELRKLDDPIAPVSKYYQSHLKPGERLWWTGNPSNESVPATIKTWKNVSPEEKCKLTVYGCAFFPEVFAGEYDNYALWLTSQGIVNYHIRDQFSSGGQEPMLLSTGESVLFPAVYRRVKNNRSYFLELMCSPDTLPYPTHALFGGHEFKERLRSWCNTVSHLTPNIDYSIAMDALTTLFFGR